MTDTDKLAQRFEERRSHLRAVAYRMLGSTSEAEDAVQEAWFRLNRTDTSSIDNLGGWLTTVVSRVCLDMLRSRASRREEPIEADAPEPAVSPGGIAGADPELEAVMSDSVGAALLVVLDTLAPAERLAFVLHDLFGVPFDEIAAILDRTPTAARKLASRARQRVQGRDVEGNVDRDRQREVVDAFLAASRGGDFEALVSLLDPEAVVRRDKVAATMGGEWEATGATAVAKVFLGRANAAQPVTIDGAPGAVWAPGGKPRVAIVFTFDGEHIAAIDLVADPERLAELDLGTPSR
jgi:RNA polymerase sigma-70 factor (ECF subfamily)